MEPTCLSPGQLVKTWFIQALSVSLRCFTTAGSAPPAPKNDEVLGGNDSFSTAAFVSALATKSLRKVSKLENLFFTAHARPSGVPVFTM
eukprot:SAG31_NODE_2079_length_6498_cov_3.416159_2_plen_89_part_00